jgi:hypothetical protein
LSSLDAFVAVEIEELHGARQWHALLDFADLDVGAFCIGR